MQWSISTCYTSRYAQGPAFAWLAPCANEPKAARPEDDDPPYASAVDGEAAYSYVLWTIPHYLLLPC